MTKFIRQSVECKVYQNEMADGDPVAVIGNNGTAVPIGTGFANIDDVLGQIAYCLEHGQATANITPENAEELEKLEDIEIYIGPSAHLQQKYDIIKRNFVRRSKNKKQ